MSAPNYRLLVCTVLAAIASNAAAENDAEAPCRYLAALLPAVQAKVQANTAQWKTFRARLDGELNRVTTASYQGDNLLWAADYALGYRLLKDADPVAASRYADKAVAVMLSAFRDKVRDATGSRIFLARGDGTTTRFALPHTGGAIRPSTFKVWLAPVRTKEVKKGKADGQDEADYYHHFLKVSLTPDGPADFAKGTDWRYKADHSDNAIDWSPPGAEPPVGATYFVTEATTGNVQPEARGFRVLGVTDGAVIFSKAPGAGQAIFVEYQYSGTPPGGSAPLGYQQTSDGRGGWNNIRIDAGYSSRYLKYAAIALDWLWDYPGLSDGQRREAASMLIRWSDELRDNGYYKDSVASNYGAGHYGLRMAVAIGLQGRSPEAPRLKAEIQAYRRDKVLPQFGPPAAGKGTLQGGFWPEGWNYGPQAIRNILTSALAFESAGWGEVRAERGWANDTIVALLSQQPTRASVYEGGDGYAWPLPFPEKWTIGTIAHAASEPLLKSYANYTLRNYANAREVSAEDLILRDPAAPAAFWGGDGGLPLQYVSAGTGLAVARKDWNYDSTWLSFHCGNMAVADHQSCDQGSLTINRGADALLVLAPSVGGLQAPAQKSQFGNLMVIDDGGAGEQVYRYNQGFWYGDPGVTMPRFEGAAKYTYARGDYAAAYRHNSGLKNSAQELVRDVFYVRDADYVIVYDRATTTQPQYLKQLRWHFHGSAAVNVDDDADSWSVTVGSSKLFGRTFADAVCTTALGTVKVQSATIKQVTLHNSTPARSVRYLTAIQVAKATTLAMDAASRVACADGKMEGVLIGSHVVLFACQGTVADGTSYSVTAPAGAKLTHYLSGLKPATTYALAGADQASATASPAGVATYTTTGTGAAGSVTLSQTP